MINKKNNDNKTFKIKRNKIFKIRTKNINKNYKKSMTVALEDNNVLLWGINKVDSILLELYENKFIKKSKSKINKSKITLDNNFDPDNHYNISDLSFLNKEYERIENLLSLQTEINEEYENLLDLQDKLSELINSLNNNNKIESNNESISDKTENIDEDLENSNSSSNKTKKNKKKIIKLKPYYYIGLIPEGYREATEEEAIIHKKVSWIGKKKVSSKLYNLYEITGTIYIKNLNQKELYLKIVALQGKIKYYKKEYFNHKKNLNILDNNLINEKKIVVDKHKESLKKTLDVLNLYISNYKSLKNNIKDNKK